MSGLDLREMQHWIARLEAMDAEIREIARALAPEARQRGLESDGQDALYQAWCLTGGIRLDLAIRWLQRAAQQTGQDG